jgi:hypothetical protein
MLEVAKNAHEITSLAALSRKRSGVRVLAINRLCGRCESPHNPKGRYTPASQSWHSLFWMV